MKRNVLTAVIVVLGAALIATIAADPVTAGTVESSAGPAGSKDQSVLIIGASYTAGWGSTAPASDYANRLARDLERPTTISAEPGAGYLSRGNDGHGSFRQQVAALPSTLRPRLVIIQGGRNDAGRPVAREYAAIDATVAAVREKFEDPQIVLVGDIPSRLPVSRPAIATNNVLAEAADRKHVVFVDPIREHWVSSADVAAFRSAIPDHPNDDGHAYIAQRLFKDLQLDGLVRG
jgi:acyl-CoA thioesterase-1